MKAIEFTDDARVMSKGQVTIPKDVRAVLGINVGDRVTFIVDSTGVKVVNSAVYAIMKLQKQMQGEASKSDLFTDEDVMNWILKSRNY